MLTHGQARMIAEEAWGKGGTHSYPTNRQGAFYFGCSSHGGYVIDAAALTAEERVLIDRHAKPDDYITMGNKLMWSGRKRALRFSPDNDVRVDGQYYLFEEDNAWCLPVLFAGITTKNQTKELAQDEFDRTFKEAA